MSESSVARINAETPTGSRTITELITQSPLQAESQVPPVLRLRLHKPKSNKKVQWTNGTVDNEHMNKKKSKCCCIYVKPREFGESSSESEDECDHCHGHVEKKNKNKQMGEMGECSTANTQPEELNVPPLSDDGAGKSNDAAEE